MLIHTADDRAAWTLIGHGECPLATARPERRVPPSEAERHGAWIALGRDLPRAIWAVRLWASRGEVLALMETEKAFLCCLRGGA